MAIRLIIFLLLIISTILPSVLSDRAATITRAHRWAIMPTNTSLGTLDLHYSLLFWNDSGLWDPIKKKIRWVGGPGTCCANPADYKMITYDVETDTWAVSATPFSGGGHAYDGNAFNPNKGLHYFGLFGSALVNVWNDTSWTTLPAAPFGATTPSLTWFPEINNGQGGLVFLGSDGRLAWYDNTKWTTLPSLNLTHYNQFSEYNPKYKGVWLGGTNTVSYFMDTAFNIRTIPAAPVKMENGSTLHTCDPTSGDLLVYHRSTNVWYSFNMDTNQWSTISDMSPTFAAFSNTFNVPIPELGIILVFNHSSSNKSVYLYRHTLPVSVETTNLKQNLEFTIFPNPAKGQIRISLPAKTENNSISIFNLSGLKVKSISTTANAVYWDTKEVPAGVYILKAKISGISYSRRMLVVR